MIKFFLIVCASTSGFALLGVMPSAPLLISVIKQSEYFVRYAAGVSCYKQATDVLAQTGFTSACGKLANRIFTQPESINWHMTPYSLLQEYERNALEDIFSWHMHIAGHKKIKKMEADLERNMPFLIEYTDHGMRARFALTLFDIFKLEHAHYNSLLETPHFRASFERQQRDRLRSLVVATSYSVRLLDIALKETARRIDDI